MNMSKFPTLTKEEADANW